MEKKIDIDVDIERFENQTYSGLRNTMVKFVMGGGKESRLRDFVIQKRENNVSGKTEDKSQETTKETECTSNPSNPLLL